MDTDGDWRMRILDRLSEKEVKNAKPDRGKTIKRLPDGGGLYLQASVSKTHGINRNWIFRYQLDGYRDPKCPTQNDFI